MPDEVLPYFPYVSRWCTEAFCFLFSLKRRERNVVKPVVVCKSEEQEMSLQVRINISRWACFGQKGDLGGCLKLVGRRSKPGDCYRCFDIDIGLVVGSRGNTPHDSTSPRQASATLKSRMRWHDSIPMRSPRSSAVIRHTGLSRIYS